MMEYRRRRLPWLLLSVGALLTLWSLIMLHMTPKVLQYTIQAPDMPQNSQQTSGAEESGEITTYGLIAKAQEIRQAQYGSFPDMTMDGVRGGVRLTLGLYDIPVNLIAMEEGWLQVYPRFLKDGRYISELELREGTPVAMLDEGLMIQLYGSAMPESPSVMLNDMPFTVVGAVKHGGSAFGGRGVGDALEYDVYVPLKAALANGISMDTLTLSAAPPSASGWSTVFRDCAVNWSAEGALIDLNKEAMRGTMPLRLLALVVGLYAMFGLFLRVTDRVMGWFDGYRQALKQHYFKELLPRLAGLVALTAVCYAALVGATWLLLSFSVQPAYVFTEWVPDNFVEWSSISQVFWNLITESSALVRVGTRELRIVEFWSRLLLWGVVLALLGAALLPKARKRA